MDRISRFLVFLALFQVFGMYFVIEAHAETTPEVVVTGFEVSGDNVKEGDSFELTINLKNASTTAEVHNIIVVVDSEENYIYSDYGKGNQMYVDSIQPQETTSVVFEMKVANLAPDIVKTSIGISFAIATDDYTYASIDNNLSIWIPVESTGYIQVPEFDLAETVEEGGKARLNLMASNVGDSDISNIQLIITDGDTEVLNEIVSRSLPAGTSTSFENYIEGLRAGEHTLSAVIEYTAITGEVYTAIERNFDLNVIERSMVEEPSQPVFDYEKMKIRAVILLLMLGCLFVIRRQIKTKVIK